MMFWSVRTVRRVCCSLVVLFGLPAGAHALEKEQIDRAKEATAYVSYGDGSASAFCLSKGGLFVTNDHVVEKSKGQALKLVLNPGEDDEKVFDAEVARRYEEEDLAVLKVDLGDFAPPPVLSLDRETELFETQQLVAFGYPFGAALAVEKDSYPSISVNIGRITALRKKSGVLESIQLDAQVNPGNSGGPVLGPSGGVVGIISSGVRGAGVNFAIPVARLDRVMETPEVEVTVPEVAYDDRSKPVELVASIDWLSAAPGEVTATAKIMRGKAVETVALKRRDDGRYVGGFQPVVPDPDAEHPRVVVQMSFPDGSLRGYVRSKDVKVGEKTVPLVEISSITGGEKPAVLLASGERVEGAVQGLEGLEVDLGGEVVRVDGGKSSKMTIIPPSVSQPEVRYEVTIAKGGKDVGSVSGTVSVGAPPFVAAADGGGRMLRPGVELADKKEVPLPSEVHDIDVAGDGRFLILYLRDARKLAVFDISTLKIKGYINLGEDPVVFGGGRQHVIVFLPNSNLLQRYSLETLERDRTVNNPEGAVTAMAIGHSSPRYALFLVKTGSARDDAKFRVFDMVKMASLEVEPPEMHPFLTGSGNRLRAGGDGRTYGNTKTSGSPSGVGIVTFKNGRLSTRYEHDSEGVIIPNMDGSLIFATYGGVFTPKYVPVIKGGRSGGLTYLPSCHPMYFFGVPGSSSSSRDKSASKTAQIFIKGSNLPLVSLAEPFDEMEVKDSRSSYDRSSPMTVDKRYHFVPQMGLFLTIPPTNDRIVARPVDIEGLLEEKEIDYLYVTSTVPTAKSGTLFKYQLAAASRAGGVKFTLQTGPEGIQVSEDGLVSWIVPAQTNEETVIVMVSDALGQEFYHTFQIVVAGE